MTGEEDYEEEWENLDPKVLLVQLVAEQQRTNQYLKELTGDDTPTQEEATQMYWCTRCPSETRVKEDDRQRHAEGQHNTPPGTWESIFEPAD